LNDLVRTDSQTYIDALEKAIRIIVQKQSTKKPVTQVVPSRGSTSQAVAVGDSERKKGNGSSTGNAYTKREEKGIPAPCKNSTGNTQLKPNESVGKKRYFDIDEEEDRVEKAHPSKDGGKEAHAGPSKKKKTKT
jgi:hypothetical protein